MTAVYTQVCRPTLWLIRGDSARLGGEQPDAQPPFEVDVASFYISKTPITNEHFKAFRPSFEPHPTSPGPEHPAVNLTFDDALDYCQWYSELSGKRFRLPTEVEWEFACRAGTQTRYFFGNDPCHGLSFIWSKENSSGSAPQVETKEANPAGLHDMLGSVWEWTSSLYAPYPGSAEDAPDALQAAGDRVIRGGSYRTPLAEMGSGIRQAVPRTCRADDVGFRIVRRL